jgi:caffeoyl-CoA O-methyltransferase
MQFCPGLATIKSAFGFCSVTETISFARPSAMVFFRAMKLKYLSLTDSLYRYVCRCRSDADDPILAALRKETEALGEESKMQISQEQGTLMSLLVAAIGARSVIEVGTFTGYSSLCIARALPDGGRLICLDESEPWTAIARRYWALAGVESIIELRLGAAIPLLQKLDPAITFDFAFVDADKTEYDAYYELILPRVRSNGLILFDNMLWGGRLGGAPVTEASGQAIDALNHKLARDDRVESVLLPVADGIQICRKR